MNARTPAERGNGVRATDRATASAGREYDGVPVVLLVEDNAADADLARMALGDGEPGGRLHLVRDGEQALAFLHRAARGEDDPRPALVLLDLNLPGLDGCGVLGAIREDPALRDLPVVVLTSSAAPEDIAAAYRAGANCYVTKPLGLDAYLSTVRAIRQFWLNVATLPG